MILYRILFMYIGTLPFGNENTSLITSRRIKKRIQIDCSNIGNGYNAHMGSAVVIDSLLVEYRMLSFT